MDTLTYINSLFQPREQWATSAADNVWGMSLPEYHPEEMGIGGGTNYVSGDIVPGTNPVDNNNNGMDPALENLSFGASDGPDDLLARIAGLYGAGGGSGGGGAGDISELLKKLLAPDPRTKARAQVDLYQGALFRTLAVADDFFTRGTAIMAGQGNNIRSAAEIAGQNYQNQMDALDNQVLYMKHQLEDRFNKTVETNIMNLAARNIRVNAGNVMELTKDAATEITEDMRTAESNAKLKKIALEAGQKQAKESANYAVKKMWADFAGSASLLGIMGATGGGTGESWGNLYKGYVAGKTYLRNNRG